MEDKGKGLDGGLVLPGRMNSDVALSGESANVSNVSSVVSSPPGPGGATMDMEAPNAGLKAQSGVSSADASDTEDEEGDEMKNLLSGAMISKEEEWEQMRVLLSSFTEEQFSRYEMYRRAGIPRAQLKRLLMSITGSSVAHTSVIIMAGITKVFVGEVVEEALTVMGKRGLDGPIRPECIVEAYRRLKRKNMVPNSVYTEKKFG
eukprot:Nk52_evm31s1129 gene=Nk52_evmTU31s1129